LNEFLQSNDKEGESDPSDENSDDEFNKNNARFKKHKAKKTEQQMQRDR
jgi:hypothetical protein